MIQNIHLDFSPTAGPKPDDRLDYNRVWSRCGKRRCSQCTTRNPLPSFSEHDEPTFWSTCCEVLAGMKALRRLSVRVGPNAFHQTFLKRRVALLNDLEPLKGKGVDIEVRIEGDIHQIWRTGRGRAGWLYTEELGSSQKKLA